MTAASIIKGAAAEGVTLALTPAGNIKAVGHAESVARWLPIFRAHKPGLVIALVAAVNDEMLFDFAPLSDPANDTEALAERAAIMTVENGMDDVTALREARWQADRERCWRAFLRNADRVLEAPAHDREDLLMAYQTDAARRYGERTGTDMAKCLESWVRARAVH